MACAFFGERVQSRISELSTRSRALVSPESDSAVRSRGGPPVAGAALPSDGGKRMYTGAGYPAALGR
jgi:hypothetical protein